MKTLVVGFGSIGARHARILSELGCRVCVVSEREIDFRPSYKFLKSAIETENPEYVVIANKTNEHYRTLLELIELDFKGVLLIEKPLFSEIKVIPENNIKQIFVGYNMRFHPLLVRLNKLLRLEKIISVQAYVGQYLAHWRPKRDYRLSYSAFRSKGGGVLRDLSHELDYINWLLGGWSSVLAVGEHYSHLEIDSDDTFAIMIDTQKCPVVTVQMNYLDRIFHREVLINTDLHTFKADFIKGTLQINENIESFRIETDETYCAQHQSILNHSFKNLCTLNEGIDVMEMIHSIENSAYSDQRKWVQK